MCFIKYKMKESIQNIETYEVQKDDIEIVKPTLIQNSYEIFNTLNITLLQMEEETTEEDESDIQS